MRLIDKYGEEISRSEAIEHFHIPFSGGSAVEQMVNRIEMGTNPSDLVERAEIKAQRLVSKLIKTGKVRVEDKRLATRKAVELLLNHY